MMSQEFEWDRSFSKVARQLEKAGFQLSPGFIIYPFSEIRSDIMSTKDLILMRLPEGLATGGEIYILSSGNML
jgi:hypothetical protein